MGRFAKWLHNDPAVLDAIAKELTKNARRFWGDQLVVSNGLPYGLETKPGVIEPFGRAAAAEVDDSRRAIDAGSWKDTDEWAKSNPQR